MTETEIKEIVQKQRSYFYTGATLPVEKRLKKIKKLKTCIQKYEPLINEALKRDLGKSNFESYMCEVGLVLSELSYMIRHTPSYAKEKTVLTPLAQFASRSYKKPSPYGVVLVMSPWNYPFLLTIDPLIDAIAAGNTVVLKPSAYSPHTSRVIETIITECFDPRYVAVVNGGRAENNTLLNEHFDYIFFTGSQHVGREVMAKASVHLTPVTLELGGKSPCIVEKSANLKLAARRIVFGKYLNCGQTCVAPDYIYCDREIKDELIRQIQKQIRKQFGSTPLNNKNYGKIINEKHFTRICNLIDPSKVVCGGDNNPGALQIAPTVMDNVTFGDAVMQEEIFGPVLPVLAYDSLDEAIRHINRYNTGHSEAIITRDYDHAQEFLNRIDAAAVYVNASTRFTDGGEFGFGAEIGISTQKLHARGPMGLKALTTTKYIIYGNGQVRP